MNYKRLQWADQTTEGFHKAIATMETGEILSFKVRWQFVYGEQGLPGYRKRQREILRQTHNSSPFSDNDGLKYSLT